MRQFSDLGRKSWLLLLCIGIGCAKKPSPEDSAPQASARLAASVAVGIPSASAARAERPVSVVPLPVDAGPPRLQLSADGISVTETASGEVLIKSSTPWGESLDLRYADCQYFKGALPVLERQLSKERFALLSKVCKKK